MRYLAILSVALCLCGLLAACAPQEQLLPEQTVRYDEDGNAIGRIAYIYDEKGNRVKSTFYDAEGNVERWDEYAFGEDGRCVEFMRYNAQGEAYQKYTAADKNYLEFTPDQTVVERDAEGRTVAIKGYDDSGYTFLEAFDVYGNQTKYERYNAAGEAYISHTVDGERHDVRVVVGDRYTELYETDGYGTLRKERHVDSQTGREMVFCEFSTDGERFKKILYGYENDVLLYRIDMNTAGDKITDLAVYNGSGTKILEKKPSKENAYFSVDAPGSLGAGGDKQIRVTERYENTSKVTQSFYSITTGKQIQK